jgi:Na+/melibiose symporter-like transporter
MPFIVENNLQTNSRYGFVNRAAAVKVIRVVTGPIPLVLLACGIVCAALYPIGRVEFAKITAELAGRRTAAKEKP